MAIYSKVAIHRLYADSEVAGSDSSTERDDTNWIGPLDSSMFTSSYHLRFVSTSIPGDNPGQCYVKSLADVADSTTFTLLLVYSL